MIMGMIAPPQPKSCHMPFDRKEVNWPWLGERRLRMMIAVKKMKKIPKMIAFC